MTVQWRGPEWLRKPAEALGIGFYLMRITKLSLRGPAYDDRLVEHLAGLEYLESLTLSETKLSEQGVAALARALPQCRIDAIRPAAEEAASQYWVSQTKSVFSSNSFIDSANSR